MPVSPQAARDLFDALQTCERVLLTGPVDPDGDSLGACLALQRLLADRGTSADVAGVAGYRYDWMPGASELIPDEDLGAAYDGVVVLDGDRHRLEPRSAEAFARARVKGIIDHHASTQPSGYTHAWLVPSAASTCELIYQLAMGLGDPVDAELASLIYAGLLFDTGGFRFSNTTPSTHRLAAELLDRGIDHSGINSRVLMERTAAGFHCAGQVLQRATFHHDGGMALSALTLADRHQYAIESGDTEGLVESLVHVRGVSVAALVIERGPSEVKVSLRSRGAVDVAALANRLAPSGGGHAKAAGVSLDIPLADAQRLLIDALRGE